MAHERLWIASLPYPIPRRVMAKPETVAASAPPSTQDKRKATWQSHAQEEIT
jgi:hypothetical protein